MKLFMAIIKPFKLEAICDATNTEKIGDGKIFDIDVGQAMRIRTGETGTDAL